MFCLVEYPVTKNFPELPTLFFMFQIVALRTTVVDSKYWQENLMAGYHKDQKTLCSKVGYSWDERIYCRDSVRELYRQHSSRNSNTRVDIFRVVSPYQVHLELISFIKKES